MKDDPEPEEALAQLEYDRMSVERFRKTFPRARWDDDIKSWRVPGKTAARRLARWRALEQSRADVYADAKGRDAFLFDPIASEYLEVGPELVVRTPYSRTVVSELRQVPFARWDDVRRAWVVPYRGFEELAKRWPQIEAAARRNEPEARRRRQKDAVATPEFVTAKLRSAERRRRRFPISVDEPPPLRRPVSTAAWGVVVFTGSTGELVDDVEALEHYPHSAGSRNLVWASWRTATLEELVKTWPAKAAPDSAELSRGWWEPTKVELVAARKSARSRERERTVDAQRAPSQDS